MIDTSQVATDTIADYPQRTDAQMQHFRISSGDGCLDYRVGPLTALYATEYCVP
jgi:hypothetical protein